MKKYTIISTYPKKGSQNVGDQLITSSTINAIKAVKGDNISFNVIFREENWEKIKESVLNSDSVIFACLAIRKDMGNIEYPFLQKLIDSKIPLGILAAGTALNVNTFSEHLYNGFTKNSTEILKQLNSNSLFFTTRGVLSQAFCSAKNLTNVTHSGDIAFYDSRFSERKFQNKSQINKIAISDPHYGALYLESMGKLIVDLKKLFPKAKLTILRHGKNPAVEKFCIENEIQFKNLFLDKDNGLDEYDQFDLHVGYRVHGHVSALKRRMPSYLLEQDGRGCDYGLTLNRRISVANNIFQKTEIKRVKRFRLISTQIIKKRDYVSLAPVSKIMAMIEEDAKLNFIKFIGLEDQINGFNKENLLALAKLP